MQQYELLVEKKKSRDSKREMQELRAELLQVREHNGKLTVGTQNVTSTTLKILAFGVGTKEKSVLEAEYAVEAGGVSSKANVSSLHANYGVGTAKKQLENPLEEQEDINLQEGLKLSIEHKRESELFFAKKSDEHVQKDSGDSRTGTRLLRKDKAGEDEYIPIAGINCTSAKNANSAARESMLNNPNV